MKRILQCVGWLVVLVLAPGARAQLKVGDDLSMHMNGVLSGGYSAGYGTNVQSNHGVNFGASAELTGDYYNPNFVNFAVLPYYNRSTSDSNFQSLTDASGLNSDVNLFTGSKTPGYVSFNYARNSTGNFGLIGSPNFTTIGSGWSFGTGWSLLLPNKPTLSFSYSQGDGSGTVFGTNEQSSAATRTLSLRSSYRYAGWNLNAFYQYLSLDSKIPLFLVGEGLLNTDRSSTSGDTVGINGSHALPWNGSIALSFSHSNYSGDFSSSVETFRSTTNYSTNIETANVSFHPTQKLTVYANENYTDNLNGYLYQTIFDTGGGLPLSHQSSTANSFTTTGGVGYNFTHDLFGQTQVTYFRQSYFGNNYDGSYLSATLGYNKRILQTFTVSASVIESTNQFTNNNVGFIGNLNAFHAFGDWLVSGNFSYAQNVQSLLVTYTTSYYNYSGNVHRRLGRGKQVTFAYNGTHSGINQDKGSYAYSNGFSTSLFRCQLYTIQRTLDSDQHGNPAVAADPRVAAARSNRLRRAQLRCERWNYTSAPNEPHRFLYQCGQRHRGERSGFCEPHEDFLHATPVSAPQSEFVRRVHAIFPGN